METNKGAANDTVAFALSHDLRQPLRTAAGFCELLQERHGAQLDDTGREYVAWIGESITQAQELIDGILELARACNPAQVGVVDCEIVLGRVLRNGLRALIRERNAWVTHSPLPPVWADERHVYQLLQNLIHNGIRYSDGTPQVHVKARRDGEHWRFSVTDDGVGIRPDLAAQVFAPFQRLGRRRAGTGVGLALCRTIVERYGGRIWFESEPGQGAVFYFTLLGVDDAAD